MSEIAQVADFWSQHELVLDAPGFYTSPIMRPYIIETAFGRQYVERYGNDASYMINLLIELYLKQRNVQSVLSLCCGFGHLERQLVTKLGTIKECTGVDIAEGALAVARQRASDEGMESIKYVAADINSLDWEKQKYDLVIANGALHHLKNLEGVLSGIRQSLKPGGVFFACEYVGPSYMDHSTRQLELINAASYLVPPELRARTGRPVINERLFRLLSRVQVAASKKEKPEWPKWKKFVARAGRVVFHRDAGKFNFGVVHISPKSYLLRVDPSECVRSDEIIPLAQKYFSDLEVRPFGGGILQHALDDRFYENFDKINPTHVSTLETLCQLERHFMQTGEIGSENAFLIATAGA
ncbi:MAG: methyltransferase domain-containing protein [Gallionellaceae bacterium]